MRINTSKNIKLKTIFLRKSENAICIFEGINYEQLEPLSFPRPVYNLISGITNLKNKILRSYPGTKYSLHCRPYLAPFLSNFKISGDAEVNIYSRMTFAFL
jgi:hypothetical protein